MSTYSELHCLSHFSFLQGASSPEELVSQAARLQYQAIAITDECSLSGIVRAHTSAKNYGIKMIVGTEITTVEGFKFVLLARNFLGYGQISALISKARQYKKGEYTAYLSDMYAATDCVLLWCPENSSVAGVESLARAFGVYFWIAGELHRTSGEKARRVYLDSLSVRLQRPIVACGDVRMHVRRRHALQDTLTAIRLKTSVDQLGYAIFPNSERYLRSLGEIANIYPESWCRATGEIVATCQFDLDELHYSYPKSGKSARQSLARLIQLTRNGLKNRYRLVPHKVRALARHELRLIGELGYADYFLTVNDIVVFARARGILCQGRGSAANSVVCYALGITAVDPDRLEVLFERFVSRERNEPPDIDIDFEHERREEIIQYLYGHYGREYAAMTGSFTTYRARSAIRDVAKALGFSAISVDRLAGVLGWWEGADVLKERLGEHGYDIQAPVFRQLIGLTRSLVGRPRHLSQHTGGMVLSQAPLSQLIPIEQAAMSGRTVLQWDKNDLDALRILKVDCLGLGMLTVLHKAFALLAEHNMGPHKLADIPTEDAAVYRMIQAADTMGVFQIESRAQMALLPRLKPATFYDLVIQIAIVRPGPIQGHMVHPYLRRRAGLESVTYPSAAVEAVLARTLGVPLFQEQVIKLAMVAAGFSPGEADALRRAMAVWHRDGDLDIFKDRLLRGMAERGYSLEYAESLYAQMRGFGGYGFPESHAASFALLAYASAWLKCYVPDVYLCALLNSQPLGFYAPAQLIADARRHGVRVLPPDGYSSQAETTLLSTKKGRVVQLGLGLARDVSVVSARRLGKVPERNGLSLQELADQAGLDRHDMVRWARAGVFAHGAGSRSKALWESLDIRPHTPLRVDTPSSGFFPKNSGYSEMLADYRTLGFSLRGHPLALVRSQLPVSVVPIAELGGLRVGCLVTIGGLVISRQRPQSAHGLIFLLVEDETGTANALVHEEVGRQWRTLLLNAPSLLIVGRLERTREGVQHIIVTKLARLPVIAEEPRQRL